MGEREDNNEQEETDKHHRTKERRLPKNEGVA